MVEVVPAILTNDVSDFRKKYADLAALGEYFSKLHIDFVDGQFLPEKSLLPDDLKFFKSPFTLIGHFMTHNPQQYFQTIKQIGFSWAVVQFEAFANEEEALIAIEEGKKLGLHMGIVLGIQTPLYAAAKTIKKVEMVQLMGVQPGAQGRTFEVSTLNKIAELKSLTTNVIIAVDGGIKLGVAGKCARSGANMIIVGSAIVHATHPKESLEAFKRELELL